MTVKSSFHAAPLYNETLTTQTCYKNLVHIISVNCVNELYCISKTDLPGTHKIHFTVDTLSSNHQFSYFKKMIHDQHYRRQNESITSQHQKITHLLLRFYSDRYMLQTMIGIREAA
jgi:hypothetical protein